MRGVMRGVIVVLLVMALSGCAALDTTVAVLDVIVPDPVPDPVPVCDAQSAGTVWQGKTCLKYSDDSFRWERGK